MTHTTLPEVTNVGESKIPVSDSLEPSHERAQARATTPDQLTVLVFKDNFTARTFRIPIRWINQLGWALAASFLIALLCAGIAIKLAVTRRAHLNSGYVESESKIHDLETQLKEAQDRALSLSSANSANGTPQNPPITANSAVNAPAAEPSDAPVIDPALLSAASPISSKPFLFKGLPDLAQSTESEIPITLGAPSARWNGKMLAVRFNLQYISKTPGGQQGRIVILARGPGMMLAHPAEVFQEVGKDYLINPNKGEYFSVSRYRDTKADFGPISSRESIKEVEVLVLSSTGKLLIHENIIPGKVHGAEE